MVTLKEILAEYKRNNELKEKVLTFSHTTRYKTFIKFIFPDSTNIKAHKCEYHNNEELVFLFYGKGTYFPPDAQSDKYTNNPPVTIIYDEDSFSDINIHRLCSFDSGAYISGRFTDNVKPQKKLLDVFILENPKKDDFIALVQLLYKTNNGYLEEELNIHYDINDYPLSTFLITIDDIYRNKEKIDTNYGPQAFSIEAQVKGDIQKVPYALVVPLTYYRSSEAKKMWKKRYPNSKIFWYNNKSRHPSSFNYNLMREKVIEINKERIL